MKSITPKPATGALKVESNGVNYVPESERYGHASGLFPVWFSWNVSILGITYGIYVYSLGLSVWQAISAGIIGYLLSFFLVGFLLTPETRDSVFASVNLGGIVSMMTGAGVYAFLTYVLKIELPGIRAEEMASGDEKMQEVQPVR